MISRSLSAARDISPVRLAWTVVLMRSALRRAERIDSVTDWRAESTGDNNKVALS